MLLQRLILDDKIGFNYDYMGAAEYEFGATKLARIGMAKAFLADNVIAKRVHFIEQIGNQREAPIEVIALGTREEIESIGEELVVQVIKERFDTRSNKIVGWMRVDPYSYPQDGLANPLMLIRADLKDAQNRIDKFFESFIEGIKNEAKELEPS